MNRKVRAELHEILDDKKSGSAELLTKLNSFFIKNHKIIPGLPSLFKELERSFIQFENFRQYLIQAKKVCANREKFELFLNKMELSFKNIIDEIYRNALPFLFDKKSILTISNSKTVLEILTQLNENQNIEITICESRPKLEGRELAKFLVKVVAKINFITEAQAAASVQSCDCILIGADAVLKNGDVVNKMGSHTLAILAYYFKKPFYVITAKNKFSNKNSFRQRAENSMEIWDSKRKEISIRNYYFETIPANLVSKVITEN